MGEELIARNNFPRNYLAGSSKIMEPSAALDLIIELYGLGVGIEQYQTMIALCTPIFITLAQSRTLSYHYMLLVLLFCTIHHIA